MKNEKQIESMKNENWEIFYSIVRKIDGADIIFKYKSGEIFHKDHFYTWKNDILLIDIRFETSKKDLFIL